MPSCIFFYNFRWLVNQKFWEMNCADCFEAAMTNLLSDSHHRLLRNGVIPQIWRFVTKVTQAIYTGTLVVTQDLVNTAYTLLQAALTLDGAAAHGLVDS